MRKTCTLLNGITHVRVTNDILAASHGPRYRSGFQPPLVFRSLPSDASSTIASRVTAQFLGRCPGCVRPYLAIEDHARSRLANRVGRSLSPRPRSPFVPSCRPPHGVDLEGPLSPGSGKGQSRKQSRRDVERGSESARRIKRVSCRIFELMTVPFSRSVAHGDDAVWFELDPCGSRWTTGSRILRI